jgi:hypothetical protein
MPCKLSVKRTFWHLDDSDEEDGDERPWPRGRAASAPPRLWAADEPRLQLAPAKKKRHGLSRRERARAIRAAHEERESRVIAEFRKKATEERWGIFARRILACVAEAEEAATAARVSAAIEPQLRLTMPPSLFQARMRICLSLHAFPPPFC